MGLRADPKMEGKQKIGFYDFGQGRGFWGCHVHVLGFSELLVFAASRVFLSFALRVDLFAQHSTLVFLVCIAGSQRKEL